MYSNRNQSYAQVATYGNSYPKYRNFPNQRQLPLSPQAGYIQSSYKPYAPMNLQNRHQQPAPRYGNNHFSHNAPRTSEIQNSPGSRLFFCIKSYANNLYSSGLMQLDLETATSAPNRRSEYFRIFSALNKTQVNSNITTGISEQRKKVQEAVIKLTQENMALAVEEYKSISDSLMNEILRLVAGKIKYIPQCNKVMNYVRPQMLKRRLSEKLIPIVTTAINDLIVDLNNRHSQINSPNDHMEVLSTVTELAPKITANPSIEVEMDKSLHENRKRKNLNSFQRSHLEEEDALHVKKRTVASSSRFRRASSIPNISSSTESLVISSNIDVSTPIQNTVVHTVAEAYTCYKSFAPASQVLPLFSNAPDTPTMAAISHNLSSSAEEKLITMCKNSSKSSQDHYSLVTFHNKGTATFPKTHLTIHVSPIHFITNRQDIIPNDCKFVYEVLLFDSSVKDFKDSLRSFVTWAQSREAQYFFTVPVALCGELLQCLPSLSLVETQRPFQEEASFSLIT